MERDLSDCMQPKFEVKDLSLQPINILMYVAGSSGEFLAWALSKCLTGFSYNDQAWENNSRVKYLDVLKRSLNGGNPEIDPQTVVRRYNEYQSESHPGTQHIAMAHPSEVVIDFIKQYLPTAPVLEITLNSQISKEFALKSVQEKINNTDYINSGQAARPQGLELSMIKFENDYRPRRYQSQKHLCIEWEDIIINDTLQQFTSIQEFFGTGGDATKFVSMITDYKSRQSL